MHTKISLGYSIPENLQGGENYDNSVQAIEFFESALDNLENLIDDSKNQ